MTTGSKLIWIFVSVIIVIVLTIGVFAIIGYWGMKQVEKRDRLILEAYQKIRQKYTGLQLSKDESMSYSNVKSDLLKGVIKEVPFVCFTFETGTGKSRTYWTQFEFQHGVDLDKDLLYLYQENFFSTLKKSMGSVKEVEVGVKDFDKRFLVYSSDENFPKQVLTSTICEKLLKIPASYFGELELRKESLIYRIPYQLINKKNTDYFVDVIEFSQELLAELKRIKGKK